MSLDTDAGNEFLRSGLNRARSLGRNTLAAICAIPLGIIMYEAEMGSANSLRWRARQHEHYGTRYGDHEVLEEAESLRNRAEEISRRDKGPWEYIKGMYADLKE